MKTQIKFTPLQRYKIYRKALSAIESGESLGLCHALFMASRNIFENVFNFSVDFFPEIKKHEVDGKDWWFPLDEYGRQQRILILKAAIHDAAVKHLESQK